MLARPCSSAPENSLSLFSVPLQGCGSSTQGKGPDSLHIPLIKGIKVLPHGVAEARSARNSTEVGVGTSEWQPLPHTPPAPACPAIARVYLTELYRHHGQPAGGGGPQCLYPSGHDCPRLQGTNPDAPTARSVAVNKSLYKMCSLKEGMSPQEALQSLMEGNLRFVNCSSAHPHQDFKRIQGLSAGQKPQVAILGCADSRVPAEIVFDQGFGDVFVCRVAGNIATPQLVASLEYSVLDLGVSVRPCMHARSGRACKECEVHASSRRAPSLS